MKKILFIILTACLSFSAFAANKEVKDTAAFEPFTRNIGISTSKNIISRFFPCLPEVAGVLRISAAVRLCV